VYDCGSLCRRFWRSRGRCCTGGNGRTSWICRTTDTTSTMRAFRAGLRKTNTATASAPHKSNGKNVRNTRNYNTNSRFTLDKQMNTSVSGAAVNEGLSFACHKMKSTVFLSPAHLSQCSSHDGVVKIGIESDCSKTDNMHDADVAFVPREKLESTALSVRLPLFLSLSLPLPLSFLLLPLCCCILHVVGDPPPFLSLCVCMWMCVHVCGSTHTDMSQHAHTPHSHVPLPRATAVRYSSRQFANG
jgi:hypothetical protein